MAEEIEDPREVPWHPRLAERILGHDRAFELVKQSMASGKPHHAWLLHGPRGIGKATLAYSVARELLSQSKPAQTPSWIAARSHPDLFVLERGFNDSKPRKLRNEISVDDARRMWDFFARTSGSGGWRVAIIDAVDDLNAESANALLKLVEEPPSKCLMLLVSHVLGKSLPTLRSRCLRVPLHPLLEDEVRSVLLALPLETQLDGPTLERVVTQSQGSPGRALELVASAGAKAFDVFLRRPNGGDGDRLAVAAYFSARQQSQGDFAVFIDLLLGWIAAEATARPSPRLATLHAALAERRRIVEGYNLDRRVAVLDALGELREALKAA